MTVYPASLRRVIINLRLGGSGSTTRITWVASSIVLPLQIHAFALYGNTLFSLRDFMVSLLWAAILPPFPPACQPRPATRSSMMAESPPETSLLPRAYHAISFLL